MLSLLYSRLDNIPYRALQDSKKSFSFSEMVTTRLQILMSVVDVARLAEMTSTEVDRYPVVVMAKGLLIGVIICIILTMTGLPCLVVALVGGAVRIGMIS